MKASEVLSKYAAGERNFQGVKLRGQSFKGENLAGADFSEADLRGTNFTGANLQGANFTGAKCGLQKRWAIFLTILSWILAGISGYFTTFLGSVISLTFNSDFQLTWYTNLVVVIIFTIILIRKGINAGVVVVAAAVIVVALFLAPSVITGVALLKGIAEASELGSALIFGLVLAEVGLAVLAATAVATSVAAASVAVLAILGATAVAGAGAAAVATAVAVAVLGATALAAALAAAVVAAVVVVAVAAAAIHISWRAMGGDPRDAWVRSFAIDFAAIGGTSFRGADLTDANFSSARLKSTDMREASLTRVRWYGADMLDRLRPGKTYLKSTQVRQWLIGKGTDKNFDGQKLQGVNFQGADLTDASFIDANLSEANLRDTDLSGAQLIQTQLDQTDFTGANLTGACIEDWGITSHTKLDQVKCKYIFMRSPTKDNPNRRRKPDNWEEDFEGNDFGDFIQPIFDTLDLYHNQGVDPRAIAIAWKKLAEANPDAKLQFASMEVKGEDNLLLRFKTDSNADKSQLNQEYFQEYNEIKALNQAQKLLLIEKDNRIQVLESMVNTAIKQPKFSRNVTLEKGNYNEEIEGNYEVRE